MAVEVYLGDAPSYVKQWVESYYEKLDKPLCFTAVDDGATIQLAKNGNPDPIEIVYSTDKENWENYDFTTTITLASVGDKVYFRAKDENDVSFYKDDSNYYRFVTTDGKRVAASGNLQTLMKADGSRHDISDKQYCYSGMFYNCTSLMQAPALPATTLAYHCYSYMFQNCTSLMQAPALPATTLAGNCYSYMFQGCTSLTQASELPATTLAEYCYSYMFQDCTSLTQSPALPATTLANSCYSNMFFNCTSLTQAPTLPATTLANSCYSNMFQGCTSLQQAPELPATMLANDCYLSMFSNCTSLDSMNVSFTTWDPSTATDIWLYNAGTNAGNPVFICPSALDMSIRDNNHVPEGWSIRPK